MNRKSKRRRLRGKRARLRFSAKPSPLSLAVRSALRRPLSLTSALTLGVMLSTGVSVKALAREAQALSLNTSAEQTAVLDSALLVIDPAVRGYRHLLSGLRPGFRAVVLDSERDGLAQLGELLKAHRGVRAVHLLAHGEPGALRLGNAWVRREDLEAHRAGFESWFAPGPLSPELMIYGCNVAKGDKGRAFVDQLSAHTGANVAASDDVTGSRLRGGDWLLEHESGPIESPLAFSPETMAAYPEVLQTTFNVNTNFDAVDAIPGDGNCDDGNEKCTLRAAVMEANALAGDDTIILQASLYTLSIPNTGTGEDFAATGDLDITSDINIQGVGESQTVIDGNGLDRVLDVLSGASLTLEQTTITGGTAVGSIGGGIRNAGTATLNQSTVSDNSAGDYGGGISNFGDLATLTLTNSTVSGNSANSRGGGIFIRGTATLTNSTVEYNSAEYGGGIFNFRTATLNQSTVKYNSASKDGGGIANFGGLETLNDSNVLGNSARLSGGGIFNSANATATLESSTVSGNSASFHGGGIYNGFIATLTDSTVSGNSASSGGGIFSRNAGTAALTNSTVAGNYASTLGGGILNSNYSTATINDSNVLGNSAFRHGGIGNLGTATLSNSTVSGNSANSGGGIYNRGTATLTHSTVSGNRASTGGGIFNYGTATLNQSTVSGNTATGSGGGIRNDDTLLLENSTVSGNSAISFGGGIGNFGTATQSAVVALTQSTVSGNSAGGSGGGISIFNYGTATLANSLIANNVGGSCGGGITNLDNNLADDASCGVTVSANINLGPLGDNGGPTETHALLQGSAAIDAVIGCVNSPPSDQRGVARPQGAGCDIGAYEAEDSDNDGVPDVNDAFPLNPNETVDSDGDGMGDNFETRFGLNPNDPTDAALDNDGDGISNLDEFLNRTNPLVNEGAVIQIINSILLDD